MSQAMMVGRARLTTFSHAPKELNPLKASDRELLVHGFPTRPDPRRFPAAHKQWERVLSRPFRYTIPTFRVHPEIQHASMKNRRVQDGIIAENWSGSIVAPSSPSDVFKWVAGVWTTALSYPPSHAPDKMVYRHSSWVGIGGFTSQALVQVGVHQVVTSDKGLPSDRQCYAWWDWVPGDEIQIENFQVSPGDSINAVLCAPSPTDVTIFLLNENSLQATSFSIAAPDGGSLAGDSAEWIVERPLVNGGIAPLPRFNEIFFENTAAVASNEDLFTAISGTMIAMDDLEGNFLAGAAPDGPTLLKITSRD